MSVNSKKLIAKGGFSLFRMALLIGLCFCVLYPVLLKVLISFRSQADIMDSSIIILPKHFTFDTFKRAMKLMDYGNAFLNTLFVCTISGLLHVTSCLLAAYSLSKFKVKGRAVVYMAVALTFIVPPVLLSVPTYTIFQQFTLFGLLKPIFPKGLNLLDNPVSLFLLYGTANSLKSSLYIFLFLQFFNGMPKELDEAAAVDGASHFRTLISIALPSARLMAVTVFLFTFVWQWTDINYTSMFLRDYTLLSSELAAIGWTFSTYLTQQLSGSNPLMVSQMVSAGSIVFILPLLALYVVCNRFFVQGVESSGLVG